jgi:hypothetical protein
MLLTRKPPVQDTKIAPARRPGAASLSGSLARSLAGALPTMDRRTFLKRSGIGVGAGLAATQLSLVKKSVVGEAQAAEGKGDIVVRRTVCSHCSVGCSVDAVVQNGVWVRQEPVFDSPINLGAHCAKGAALREHGHGEYRLKTPMKLVDGRYQRISWEQALNEIVASDPRRLVVLADVLGQAVTGGLVVCGLAGCRRAIGFLLQQMPCCSGSAGCCCRHGGPHQEAAARGRGVKRLGRSGGVRDRARAWHVDAPRFSRTDDRM